MSDIRLTEEQRSAVENRGGALLVSAAAGSGKTRVLVDRLLRQIRGDGYDVTDFLIITYTKAAASELRGKIADALAEAAAEEPQNRHLRRQLALCCRAQIGTIHSFCVSLIRENAHLLNVSPDFAVLDECDSGRLKAEVLDDVLEKRYDDIENDPAFAALADTVGAGRDDSRLVSVVLETYDAIRSHPYPERWVREQVTAFRAEGVSDLADTVWGRFLMTRTKRTAEYLMGRLSALLDGDPLFLDKYGESLAATLTGMEKFIGALDGTWDGASAVSAVDFPRPKPCRGCDDLKAVRKKCKDELEKAAAPFRFSSRELLEDIGAVRPQVECLFDVVLQFSKAYAAEKRRRCVLDFSDQEHMAKDLLADPETGLPTALAAAVSARYREILVDEYQDVNRVQDLIFRSASRNGKNLFMVGDVKQSIYRFRLADPTIFLEKYRAFPPAEEAEDGKGRKVVLSKNFRSRNGVLQAVNFLFKNIMSTEFGEMDYTEKEYLYPGAAYSETEEAQTELDVVDLAGGEGDDEETPEKSDAEAAFVAGRIERLMKETSVAAGDGFRKLRYDDIAVLMRSPGSCRASYEAAFARRGIPVSGERSGGFFDTMEISVMVSLLSVIDNPHQDVALTAVLMSPLFGFSADELAKIRLADKTGDFFTAFSRRAETDGRCRAFLDRLETYREEAPDRSADELIWYLYGETGAPGVFGALPGGEARRANLMTLLENARRFEEDGYKGLFGFVAYLRGLKERGEEPEFDAGAEAESGVRLMSIHKSKGLEFPVVILADTARKVNRKDTLKPLLVHPELGIGPKRVDTVRKIAYPTLPRLAIVRKVDEETLSEELRILYVAMTRAREKLIMVASFADAEKEIGRLLAKSDTLPVPPAVLESTGRMCDWILLPALLREEAEPIRFGLPVTPCPPDGQRWDVRLVKAAELLKPEKTTEKAAAAEPAAADPALVRRIRERLAFVYPHRLAGEIPSKLTATELKGRYADGEVRQEADIAAPVRKPIFRRPDFSPEKRLTGAEKGTALHLVMQYIDYGKCGSLPEIEGEIARLRGSETVTPAQASAVDPQKILRFFRSETGRALSASPSIRREFKFSVLVPAETYFPGAAGDEIMLQGVVDCYFQEPDGSLTVLDFKTDFVNEETLPELAKLYAPQIGAYARALEKITGKPVKRRILYFFSLDRAVLTE